MTPFCTVLGFFALCVSGINAALYSSPAWGFAAVLACCTIALGVALGETN
jgi:hypothetical protein